MPYYVQEIIVQYKCLLSINHVKCIMKSNIQKLPKFQNNFFLTVQNITRLRQPEFKFSLIPLKGNVCNITSQRPSCFHASMQTFTAQTQHNGNSGVIITKVNLMRLRPRCPKHKALWRLPVLCINEIMLDAGHYRYLEVIVSQGKLGLLLHVICVSH